jgi:1-aminocyclopropane-1-carboxylate deaminase/D-cysteine desulfhydrase-like pyridoxal-dependent ACC family enzyme
VSFPDPVYPTPLRRLAELCHASADVWLKDDGQTHSIYGGNKVRQVSALVRDAAQRGARRSLTFGPAGSHHVLTTTLFARAQGLAAAAVLMPQPKSEHAVETLRASLGAGLQAFPAVPQVATPLAFARAINAGDVLIAPGGFGPRGAAAYADALSELVAQFRALGEGPPDCVIVPLGTGVTSAGLLAGAALERVTTTIVAVSVLHNPLSGVMVRALAAEVLAHRGVERREIARAMLRVERGFVGERYGAPTPAGERAVSRASELGIELDPTYTAKTFAHVLELVERLRAARRARPLRIVYWHTLSAVSLAPLLRDAPSAEELPREIRRLFV